MITGRGMQAFLEHLEDAGVLIPKPGQLQTWAGKISRKFPDATDADLARAADVLDETPGFVRLGDLVNFLKGTPIEIERIDRANRLNLVTMPANGGDLYPARGPRPVRVGRVAPSSPGVRNGAARRHDARTDQRRRPPTRL